MAAPSTRNIVPLLPAQQQPPPVVTSAVLVPQSVSGALRT